MIDRFQLSYRQTKVGVWEEVTHVFEGYGTGLRFISFWHAGKDSEYWAGYYGAMYVLYICYFPLYLFIYFLFLSFSPFTIMLSFKITNLKNNQLQSNNLLPDSDTLQYSTHTRPIQNTTNNVNKIQKPKK